MTQRGIAINLYTVREPAQADWREALKRVRDCGFECVQWSGMPELPADEILDGLQQAGLRVVSAHCAVEPWEADFDAELDFYRALGITDLAVSTMMDDCRDTRVAFLVGAERLNVLGARMLSHHIRLSYHTHDWDFEWYAGDRQTRAALLLESVHVENLTMELDVAWAQVAGEDPATVLRRYPRRCPLVHVKDFVWNRAGDKPTFVPLGKGIVDWDEVLEASQAACTDWLIYEQDSHEKDVWDNVRASYRFLERAGLG